MSLTITSLLALVFGSLMLAMQMAWQHSGGIASCNAESRVALNRIRYMISQAGIYRVAGESQQLGVAVLNTSAGGETLPQTLVVWSGGRTGGMATQGLQSRLPLISELVIYTLDPGNSSHLIEVVASTNTNSIDFAAANFASTVQSLLAAPQLDKVLLCDRIRQTNLSGTIVGNVHFEMFQTPSDAAIAAATPGTTAWNSLTWCQGIVASDSGLRQATVRTELQLEPALGAPVLTTSSPTALAFLGSASCRYVYFP
ncbi:MAG TPA: hypothetical protein VHB77_03250 [Planctomycetaceae bacterium]|nr:hypothetical protein [Planctomycetaceae bacterium]